jgi:hypothetical protein
MGHLENSKQKEGNKPVVKIEVLISFFRENFILSDYGTTV